MPYKKDNNVRLDAYRINAHANVQRFSAPHILLVELPIEIEIKTGLQSFKNRK